MRRTVKTQAELDAALADPNATEVWIDSPKHVGIVLSDTRDKYVAVTGSATVERVTGSATVERVTGSATVKRVTGSATVKRVDGTAVILRLDGAAHVDHAGSLVTVYLYSGRATVEGGRVVDLTAVDWTDPAMWCEFNGIEVEDGHAIVYKAVDDDLISGYNEFAYPIGQRVEAPDWQRTNECGQGLHFGASPRHAEMRAVGYVSRYEACRIDLSEAIAISRSGPADKIKARWCEVLYEVDRDGERLTVEAVA